MPQDLTVPGWYNDNHYISEKVDECNTIKFGAVEGEEFTPWTAESVRDFLAQANQADSYAPWMGYDNFVESGNAENCSPNPLFNVMEYVYAKANQLNAMNDGAGYGEYGNHWNGALVLKFFNDNNITAWDHFTTSGQFEGVNPSNAMDLSEFLTKKAAQCNDMEFDGKSDWDEQAVLDYYAANGLNAVMVAENSNDPNIVAVPENEQVSVPQNVNPWGIGINLFDVNLTTANDVVSDEGIATNFIGEVATSASKSTLNPGDQITGTDVNDELTVAMNGVWSGFRGDGFMKGVPTVNIDNTTENRDLSFYANGIEGATTYNVDGNVSLYNLNQAGIEVNLSNVDTNAPINLSFTKEAIKGKDDSLTLGLDNVRIPNRDVSADGHLRYTPVNIDANDIEHLTVNSTGSVENRVDLSGINTAKDLTVTGDADLNVSATGSYLKTIDGTAATGDVSINAAPYGAFIEKAAFGSGDDTLSVWNIKTDAEIDGGEGSDNLVMFQGGVYQLAMTGVEAISASNTAGNLSLDGSNTDGFETLNLANQTSDTTLTNFSNGILNVNASGSNAGDLTVTDIPEIAMTVGDGNARTSESFTGNLIAKDAQNLSITTESNSANYGASASFASVVSANNARSLMLNAGQESNITIQNGSDLSQVDQIQIGGNGGAIVIDGNIGTEANSLYVNAQNLVGGSVTAEFADNADNDGVLNYYGTNTGTNKITVDDTYGDINFYGGANNDVLTIEGTAPGANGQRTPWTPSNLTGDLGVGTDRLVVKGEPFVEVNGVKQWSDFSAFIGVESLVFTDPDAVNWDFSTFPAKNLPAGCSYLVQPEYDVTGNETQTGTTGNDSFVTDITPDSTGGNVVLGGAGGNDTFSGTVDNAKTNLTLNGGTGSVDVDFGPDAANGQMNVQNAAAVTVNGGAGDDNITGTLAGLTAPVAVNPSGASAGNDNIDLTVGTTNDVTINGSNGEESKYDVTVTSAKNVDLNSGNAAAAVIDVQAATGTVKATTGAGNDTVSVDVTNNANNPVIATGAGDDTIDVAIAKGLTTAITLTPGDGKDNITVATAEDGAANSVTLSGAVTADDTLNVNLTGTTVDLSGLTGTYTEGVTLQGTSEASILTGGAGNDVLISGPVSWGWGDAAKTEVVPGTASYEIKAGDNANYGTVGSYTFDPDGTATAASFFVPLEGDLTTTAKIAAAIADNAPEGYTAKVDKANTSTVILTQDVANDGDAIVSGATLTLQTPITKGSVTYTLEAGDGSFKDAASIIFDIDGDTKTTEDQVIVNVANDTNTAQGLATAIATAVTADTKSPFTATSNADGKVTFTPKDPTKVSIAEDDNPTFSIIAKTVAGEAKFTLGGSDYNKANAASFDPDGAKEGGVDAITIPLSKAAADANGLASALATAANALPNFNYTATATAANLTFVPKAGTDATIEDATLAVQKVAEVGSSEIEFTAGATLAAGKYTFIFDPDGKAGDDTTLVINVNAPAGGGDPTAKDVAEAISTAAEAKADFGYTVDDSQAAAGKITLVPINPLDAKTQITDQAAVSFKNEAGTTNIAEDVLKGEANSTATDATLSDVANVTETGDVTNTVPADTELGVTISEPVIVATNTEHDASTGITAEPTDITATVAAMPAVPGQEGVQDTLTGGAGDDTFVVQLANAATFQPNVAPDPTVVIKDFGDGNDTIVFGSSATTSAAVVATTVTEAYGSIEALVQAAMNAINGTNNAFIATDGTDTYVAYGTTTGQLNALVQLEGVAIGDVAATDIYVGA